MDNQTPTFKLNKTVQQPIEMPGDITVVKAGDLIAQMLAIPENVKATKIRARSKSGDWIVCEMGPSKDTGEPISIGGQQISATYIRSQYAIIKYGYKKAYYGYYEKNGEQ